MPSSAVDTQGKQMPASHSLVGCGTKRCPTFAVHPWHVPPTTQHLPRTCDCRRPIHPLSSSLTRCSFGYSQQGPYDYRECMQCVACCSHPLLAILLHHFVQGDACTWSYWLCLGSPTLAHVPPPTWLHCCCASTRLTVLWTTPLQLVWPTTLRQVLEVASTW